MADAVQMPSVTASKYFYWPSCELTRPLTASTADVTAYWSVVPRDEDGVALTGGFLTGITNRSGKTETVWVALSAVAADGLSATVVRGIDIMGPDYTVGSSDFVYALESGSPVFNVVSPNIQNLVVQALQGGVGTGANAFRIGDVLAGDKYLYAQNADASKPFIRYNDTGNQWEISNDGVSSFVPGTGAGAITGGDGISVTAGDIDVDLTDTTVFVQSSSGAGDAGKVARLSAGTGKLATGFVTAAPFTTYISDSAALVGGAASNADALHTHSSSGIATFTAGEDLTVGQTTYTEGITKTTLSADADVYVAASAPNTVFNGTSMDVRDATDLSRAFIHFDISAQPASVEKAFLKVYFDSNASGGARKLVAHNLSAAFSESTTTYNLQPGITGDNSSCNYDIRNAYAAGNGVIFDITTIYNSLWSVNNYGISIRWSDETASTFLAVLGSRSNATSARRPQLILLTKTGNYGKEFKTSAATNVPGFKGIVTATTSSGGSVPVQLTGVNASSSGLTAHSLYKAGTGGVLSAATNALDAQAVSTSTTTTKLMDKRKEYASDVLATQETIGDNDSAIVAVPAGMVLDNITLTARCTSATYNQDGWVLSKPTDTATTTSAVGMATVDVL